jgi:hypothetical protein
MATAELYAKKSEKTNVRELYVVETVWGPVGALENGNECGGRGRRRHARKGRATEEKKVQQTKRTIFRSCSALHRDEEAMRALW